MDAANDPTAQTAPPSYPPQTHESGQVHAVQSGTPYAGFGGSPPGLPNPVLNAAPSSNAVTALVLGLVSLLCGLGPFTGIPAWVIGRLEIRKADKGEAPSSGRATAAVGMYLGIMSTVITLLALVIFGLIMTLAWQASG